MSMPICMCPAVCGPGSVGSAPSRRAWNSAVVGAARRYAIEVLLVVAQAAPVQLRPLGVELSCKELGVADGPEVQLKGRHGAGDHAATARAVGEGGGPGVVVARRGVVDSVAADGILASVIERVRADVLW